MRGNNGAHHGVHPRGAQANARRAQRRAYDRRQDEDRRRAAKIRAASRALCIKLGLGGLALFVLLLFMVPGGDIDRPCEPPRPPHNVEQLCEPHVCHYACSHGLVLVAGDLTRRCEIASSGAELWMGEQPVCALPEDVHAVTEELRSKESWWWLEVTMVTLVALGVLVFVVVSISRWMAAMRQRGLEMEADVLQELSQHKLYVGVFHSPDQRPLQGLFGEMQMMQDHGGDEAVVVPEARSLHLKLYVQQHQPVQVNVGMHTDENGDTLFADGAVSQPQILQALRQSTRLRLVVLNACRTGALGDYISWTLPGVFVICFTTRCADMCCRLFSRALYVTQATMTQQYGVTIEHMDIPTLFCRAVLLAHREGFRYGDPEPYLRRYHGDPAVRRAHDASEHGVESCLGCYPPYFGEVVLKLRGVTWTATKIVATHVTGQAVA